MRCGRITSIEKWCSREDLNLHGFPHTVLSRTRLPFRHVSSAVGQNAHRAPMRKSLDGKEESISPRPSFDVNLTKDFSSRRLRNHSVG
jgi:hypothetical protein